MTPIPGKLYQLMSEYNTWILAQERGTWDIRCFEKTDFVFESNYRKMIQPKTIILALNQKIFNALWSEKYGTKIIHSYFLIDNKPCRLTPNYMTDFLKDWVLPI